MLRVAVCITTRNRRAELARTISRLAALDPRPDELVIAADGCTDDTADLVRSTAPDAQLLIHDPGRGSIPSRNAMAQATACELFLSLDDDSHPIEPDAIARIRSLFEKNPRLAVAAFPQRTDEHPASLEQPDFGGGKFIGTYANSGAAVRRSVFADLGGYVDEFVHAYEEPDFALRCVCAGWQVRFEPAVTIRHYWTTAGRNEVRIHHRHARNEQWSALLRCPFPALPAVASFRAFRQFAYAVRRGWILREPAWWWQCARGIGRCLRRRAPLPWRKYRAWMQLVRTPHDDAEKWRHDFCGE